MSWYSWLRQQKPEPEVVVETVYKVVELKAPRSQPWTREIKDAVATLPSHPGFIAIQDRFELQRQMLKEKCATEFHKDLRESDYLQAGVFWLGYCQRLIEEATRVPRAVAVDPYTEELEAFRKLDAQIERIGMEQGPQAPQQ